MQQKLYKLAHELDSEMGAMNGNRITLNDVHTVLAHLREDMDNTKIENVRFCFHEFHRAVRMLDDLLSYTIDDFNSTFETASDIKQEIFKLAAKQEGFHADEPTD